MNKNKHNLSTLGILFTIATGTIHFINKSIIASSSSKDLPDSAKDHRFYQWRFGKIHYTKQGIGKPLLLIHDLQSGASSYEWDKAASALAESHEVYMIDLLGCGQSDKPQITYTNFLYVQLICDFIKNVIGKKADVIASGYSGSFSVMACHNDEDLFRNILLVNPPDFKQLNRIPNKNSNLQKLILESPVFGTMIYNIFMCRKNIEHMLIENSFYNPFCMDSSFVDAFYENAHKDNCQGKYVYASQVGKYTNISITNCLKKTSHSIYIIEGSEEPSGKKTAQSYMDVNPAIETSYVERTKHYPHFESPEEFVSQADIFLK